MRPADAFGPIALVFGLVYLVLTPPFQVPDEFQHFFRAYQISELRLRATQHDGVFGGWLPGSVWEFATRGPWNATVFHAERKIAATDILPYFLQSPESEPRTFVDFPASAEYSPVPYIPQAFGIAVARGLRQPPIAALYLARVCNLVAYILLVRQVLVLAPVYLWVLFLIALMPMTVFQAASCSPDGVTIALMLLLIAAVLRHALVEAGPFDGRSWGRLTGLAALAQLAKPYLPMLLLFFLIPAARFRSRWHRALTGAGFLLLGATPIALWSRSSATPIAAPSWASPGQQLAFMRAHPGTYLLTMVTTVATSGWWYLEMLVGVLGWLDTRLPRGTTELYLIALVTVALLDKDLLVAVPFRKKVLCGVVFALTTALTLTTLYVRFTAPGAPTIGGMQGRYLIPTAPLLLLVLYNRRIRFDLDRWWQAVVACALVALSCGAFALVTRYFVAAAPAMTG